MILKISEYIHLIKFFYKHNEFPNFKLLWKFLTLCEQGQTKTHYEYNGVWIPKRKYLEKFIK